MKQFNLNNNILKLKVKKSPLGIRIVMFFFAFVFFVFPLLGAIINIISGGGMQFGYFIGIGLFSVMGFYLLRVALWNTYGEETIEFFENKITYEANYGWFKDGKKEMSFAILKYSFKLVGYEEDNEGVLVIASEESLIESVVKMPINQVEELISILQSL
ncbi:hypothetical protein [Flavobacterium sp. AJR]|uniref:hypothetical protein n=1 Tax=Flavobacterium sp. AJR TaxID=1979369 RepID=UPI000A3D6D80|nr:hypothetical protein [Flavobacterium sp. AJR]OUL60440.1 hypothetical protein B8T70_20290 [Flavobacterium sp. AJR]